MAVNVCMCVCVYVCVCVCICVCMCVPRWGKYTFGALLGAFSATLYPPLRESLVLYWYCMVVYVYCMCTVWVLGNVLVLYVTVWYIKYTCTVC